jgi:hypothetical protein
MEGLVVGRIVHYVLESGHSKGDHRPAIVVRDWSNQTTPGSDGMVQLQVFTDGWNDNLRESHLIRIGEQETTLTLTQNSVWRTSVHYSEEKEPGTWHWPEKV